MQGKAAHSSKSFLRRALPALCLSLLLAAVPAQAVTLKIATLAPDGTKWMEKIRQGAEEVSQRTGGRVKFKFYPGGIMGSDTTVRRKIRIGQLQGGAMTGGVFADVFPDSQLYSLPLLFNDYREMDYVRARMDGDVVKGLEKSGFVTFGITEGGFAYLMSKEPVRGIDDLRSRKVWVPEGDLLTRTVFENIGITPIPLPVADVYTGLQTGLIDTIGTSPIGAIALQWHTQVRYVTDVPIMYLYGVLAVDKRAFDRVAAADRKVVHQVMGRIFSELNRENRNDNINAIKALHQQGLNFVDLTPPEMDELRTKVVSARRELSSRGFYSKDMYNRLQTFLRVYRAKNGVLVK